MNVPKNALKQISSYLVLLLIVFAARSSLADHYHVPSGSMMPTVEVGDKIFVDKRTYGLRLPFSDVFLTRLRNPSLGDVVVLDSPKDDKLLLKRIVGLPGQSIEVQAGEISLDGVKMKVHDRGNRLSESIGHIDHKLLLNHGGGRDYGPVTIPEGHVLVMGDNRGDSLDGRSFGSVPIRSIRGKAKRVIWRKGPSWKALDLPRAR